MLIDEVKRRMLEAMKAKRPLEKEILRVALGDLQSEQSRSGNLTDEQAEKILRKIIKSNEETIAAHDDADTRTRLAEENQILGDLLPKTLDDDAIRAALADVEPQIKEAGNDGQATGIAMKHLKSAGASVTGQDVSRVVKSMRGS